MTVTTKFMLKPFVSSAYQSDKDILYLSPHIGPFSLIY